MIKINLSSEHTILKFHYENLTIQRGKESTIESFLDERITKFAHPSNQDKVDFYEYLKSIVIKDKNGFSILTSKPLILEKYRRKIENKYSRILDSVYSTDSYGKTKTVRQDLLKIFYYESYEKWQAYALAKKIGVGVCPYCNRNYTNTVGTDNTKGTRFQYDHFFDKARYPYLALSFFNLVPSCNTCNSDLKQSKQFSVSKNIHPYIDGFGDNMKFTLFIKDIDFIAGKPSPYKIQFKIAPESKWPNEKINAAYNNVQKFRLLELYNNHKDYVAEIIQRSIVYNQASIEDIYERHKGDLFTNIDEVKRMVLGNYINEKDYSKRPLAKLTADISRELGLI